MKKLLFVTVGTLLVVLMFGVSALATNGMDLEGYGPRAQGMGGTSMALSEGTAAVINNPATLSLMEDGSSRLDVAFGFLGPNISSSVPGAPEANSSADAFFMPAMGYIQKRGKWAYGVGVFGQGGMGAEYASTSFLALNSGDKVRSEVSVGRFIIPVAYQLTERLAVAGSVDLLWAGMDIKMAIPATTAMGLISGTPTLPLPPLGANNWMRLDFSNDTQFTGEAKGFGADVKVGVLCKLTDTLRLGGTYHAQPHFSDMETDNATIAFGDMTTGAVIGSMPGKVKVKDFRWPAMAGAGLAWDVSDSLTLALDLRYLFWSDAMENVVIEYESSGGGDVTMSLPQNWDDQLVYEAGAALEVTDSVTLRGGYNFAQNPVPDELMNPLFPATVEHHITGGIGCKLSEKSSIDMSVVYAPENEVTNGDGITTTHSQISGQLLYSMIF